MPVMAEDPFALLGLPRTFNISMADLQAAYLKRTAALHPDRVSDPALQHEAARQAARMNDARNTLANDEQRANALLILLGGPTREQDKSLPESFLIDMMEIRQELEHALQTGDEQVQKRLKHWAHDQRNVYITTLTDLFESARSESDQSTLREIRRQLNGWRYIERMIEQLDPEHARIL
jgi:molecular chaperone HscB